MYYCTIYCIYNCIHLVRRLILIIEHIRSMGEVEHGALIPELYLCLYFNF